MGDTMARYVERSLPTMDLDTLNVAIRSACGVLLPLQDAIRELDVAICESLPTLERLRAQHVTSTRGGAPPSSLAALRMEPGAVAVADSILDDLEEECKLSKGTLGVIQDAMPVVFARLRDDVATFEAALPIFEAERTRVHQAILAEIDRVAVTGEATGRIALDHLASLVRQEQDAKAVLAQLRAALT